MKISSITRVLRYFLIIGIFFSIGLNAIGTNAPVTRITSIIEAEPGQQVTVPITVTGFDNISGFTLAIDYEFSKLQFISGTQNPDLAGICSIGEIDLENGFHRLTISWFSTGAAISLPDETSIVNYEFEYVSGTASLTFYDNGPSCVYNDENIKELNDVPTSGFYLNGIVSDKGKETAYIAASGPTTFFEGSNVTLTSSEGDAYLWSTGDTTSSIVVNTSGSYTVQTKDTYGILSEPSEPVVVKVISPGSIELNYRMVNPRIVQNSIYNYLEFDIQVKSNEETTFLWNAQVDLSFNEYAFSPKRSDWIILPDSAFCMNNSLGNEKYNVTYSLINSNLSIKCTADPSTETYSASESDFAEISPEYQTLVSIRTKIISNTRVSGIVFNESSMNGTQSCKISSAPWNLLYSGTNSYDSNNFNDLFVGRIYASGKWTQVDSLDFSKAINTSVWNGDAILPDEELFNASTLKIHDLATLTIPSNGMMSVSEVLNESEGGIIILSDKSSTGSLISRSGSGSAIVMQYLHDNAWHVIASPLEEQSISNFFSNNPNTVMPDDPGKGNIMDFNPEWNEWNGPFSTTSEELLEPGTGYKVKAKASGPIYFEGSLKAGDFMVNGVKGKWNCIGNPYTSSIRINGFTENNSSFLSLNSENLDSNFGAIYLWNEPNASNGYTGSFTAISNASECVDVQSGQAFFVKLDSTNGSMDFSSVIQIHNLLSDAKSIKTQDRVIKVNASSELFKTSTSITFNTQMSKGIDPTYDAGLLKGNSDLIIYSHLVDDIGIPFAIQALPTDDYSKLVIPLGLDFKTGGEVVFSVETTNLPTDSIIILEDKLTNTYTRLLENDYTTIIPANSSISDRFLLHTSTITTDLRKNRLREKLNAYAIHNKFIIISGKVYNSTKCMLYDLNGRLILSESLNSGVFNKISLPILNSGIYILHVKENGRAENFKILIQE